MKRHAVSAALDQLVLRADYLVDCGNSRSKISKNADTLAVIALDDRELAEWLSAESRGHCFIHAGNEQRSQLFEQLASTHGFTTQRFVLPAPELRCGHYASMGLDRLCAGIAAIQRSQADVIVLDAGTMLTLSAWRFDSSYSFAACFSGGFIAPGPQVCLSAMHQAAPRLPALDISLSVPDVGFDTPSHMQAAITHGWPALVRALLGQVQAVLPQAQLYCSGGNLDLLTDRLYQTRDQVLVLRGMQLLAAAP